MKTDSNYLSAHVSVTNDKYNNNLIINQDAVNPRDGPAVSVDRSFENGWNFQTFAC